MDITHTGYTYSKHLNKKLHSFVGLTCTPWMTPWPLTIWLTCSTRTTCSHFIPSITGVLDSAPNSGAGVYRLSVRLLRALEYHRILRVHKINMDTDPSQLKFKPHGTCNDPLPIVQLRNCSQALLLHSAKPHLATHITTSPQILDNASEKWIEPTEQS